MGLLQLISERVILTLVQFTQHVLNNKKYEPMKKEIFQTLKLNEAKFRQDLHELVQAFIRSKTETPRSVPKVSKVRQKMAEDQPRQPKKP